VAGAGLLVANAVAGAALYVFGQHPVFSAASLAAHDRATGAKTAYIREHLPAGATVVLATADVLVARYYLPGYEVWYADNGTDATYSRRLGADTTLVVYEPRARPPEVLDFRRIEVAPGVWIDVAPVSARTLAIRGVDIDAARP
jgi:hypothetical protein